MHTQPQHFCPIHLNRSPNKNGIYYKAEKIINNPLEEKETIHDIYHGFNKELILIDFFF